MLLVRRKTNYTSLYNSIKELILLADIGLYRVVT